LLMAGSTGGDHDEDWRLARREEMVQAKGTMASVRWGRPPGNKRGR
jgi:hypothetical protein